MFEHKKHPLLPFSKFIIRALRFSVYSLLIISFALLIGTTGYHFIAGLGWVDSFYNASMILTGMGPVAVLKTSGAKIFASFYALFSGVAFLTTTAVLFAPIVHRFIHKMHIDEFDEA